MLSKYKNIAFQNQEELQNYDIFLVKKRYHGNSVLSRPFMLHYFIQTDGEGLNTDI